MRRLREWWKRMIRETQREAAFESYRNQQAIYQDADYGTAQARKAERARERARRGAAKWIRDREQGLIAEERRSRPSPPFEGLEMPTMEELLSDDLITRRAAHAKVKLREQSPWLRKPEPDPRDEA